MAGLDNIFPHLLLNKYVNKWGIMKKSAYTQNEFINKVNSINPDISVVGNYTGVENKIEISCKHKGNNTVYAYSLLKPRNCCRSGYFETRKLYNKKDIEQRKKEIDKIFESDIDTQNITYNNSRDKILNLFCKNSISSFCGLLEPETKSKSLTKFNK